MKLNLCSVLVILLFYQCANKNIGNDISGSIEPLGYYSDYFVFIGDDGSFPLVVPIDINWTLHKEGYEVEYKSWYGTEQNWPIEYYKKNITAKVSDIPKEAFDHLNTESFSFDKENRTIAAIINGGPEVQIQIPGSEQWVSSIIESDFPTYAFKTQIKINNKYRSGWMLYERIRFEETRQFAGFEAFYWMPLVVNGDLYHFTQHRGIQTAVRWSRVNDSIKVEAVPNFAFKIVETGSDTKSKRKEIPKTVQLNVPEWELALTLKSTGEQVGYGQEFPKGFAFFRQSLLQSEQQSADSAYGMMELILADN